MRFLETRKLTKFFGGLAAVMMLDMEVEQGRIAGIIGPNGAGKSTALNMIGGTQLPSKGKIVYNGRDISRTPMHRRAQYGIGRVFQENPLFKGFTALENVLVGFHLQRGKGLSSIFMNTPFAGRAEAALQEKALEILAFVGLESSSGEPANDLPHGKQRLLCLAVALAVQPRLLLLDEPLTGMNAVEVDNMLALIRALKKEKGTTCIIIEHNMRAVMGLCDRITVLNFGRKIAEGTPEEILNNPLVEEAYLGSD